MTNAKHTPLKWFAKDVIRDANGNAVNLTYESNASFIVTAVNSHYDLLEALKMSLGIFRSQQEFSGIGNETIIETLENQISKIEGAK